MTGARPTAHTPATCARAPPRARYAERLGCQSSPSRVAAHRQGVGRGGRASSLSLSPSPSRSCSLALALALAQAHLCPCAWMSWNGSDRSRSPTAGFQLDFHRWQAGALIEVRRFQGRVFGAVNGGRRRRKVIRPEEFTNGMMSTWVGYAQHKIFIARIHGREPPIRPLMHVLSPQGTYRWKTAARWCFGGSIG
jgi:hypothetical protein